MASIASAQIRVMSYNIAQFKGDANAMTEVLIAASNDESHGFATPVSIFLFQEVDEAELSILQSVVGSAYTLATFTDQNDSSWGGAQAMFYHSSQCTEIVSLHEDIYTGASRHADRWGLSVIGYPGTDIFLYSMHLKASQGTDNQEIRRNGAENVRDDIMTLPTGSHIIVAGDMNFYSPSEPAYIWFTDAGAGQVIDPLGTGQSWGGSSNTLKHTQSPLLNQNGGLIGGGLDDRFDFQFLSASLLDGGGFDVIDGTYRPFGNDGNHYNGAINQGNNYYFPGDTQRGNALADALIIASDHLPLLADYQLPAILGWSYNAAATRVLVGATTSVDFEISNDAPVSHPLGADILHVNVVASGDLNGKESVSVLALSNPENITLPIDTSIAGSWNATITLTSMSAETQTIPEVLELNGEVINHGNPSFSSTSDIDWFTHIVSFEEGSGVQTFSVWFFNYEYTGDESLVEIDAVTESQPPLVYEGMSTSSVGSIPSLISFSIDTNVLEQNIYNFQMPIEWSDENIPGEQSGISMLTVRVDITPNTACDGDFNGDGQVNVEDLLGLIGGWDGSDPLYDLDYSGTVGVSDLLLLIAAWGSC